MDIDETNNKSIVLSIERKFKKNAKHISKLPKFNIISGNFIIRSDRF